jgi:probable addiction module antidote protein
MNKKLPTFHEDLIESLKDPKERAAYLSAAIEDGDNRVLLQAFRDVAEACGGVGKLASRTSLARESLYRTLSGKGNPTLDTLQKISHELGVKMTFQPERQKVVAHR